MVDSKNLTINLIQDIATPHNNVLIAQLKQNKSVRVKLWYAVQKDQNRYQWNTDISQEHLPATLFGTSLNPGFLWHCLKRRDEKFVIVGWANTNTRLLHLLFFLLRRRFNHWTDHPNPGINRNRGFRNFLRWLSYVMLRYSNCKVFAVGKTTMEFFRARGFTVSRLVNLPIFVEVDQDPFTYHVHRSEVFARYNVTANGFLVSAGSRLIFEKGYDLLIDAVSKVRPEMLARLKVVIVGSGDQQEALANLINAMALGDHVVLQSWLSIEEFRTLIACSDVFVHPSRFDSYGGTTLGMALGVPVIGSTGAGAAVDRIEHGVNGFLYAAEDTEKLAEFMSFLFENPQAKAAMGKAARQTALQWHPRTGVEILVENAI